MAKTDETKKRTTAAKSAAKKATGAKPAAAKATGARPAAARAEATRTARRSAAPAKRVVARPVTRVARRAEPARPREEKRETQPKREKVAAKALPTAPEGQAPLIAADGSSSGSIALPAAFMKGASRAATLFQAFIAERANARQATAATKSRAHVAGGGKKPWSQKGTGRARQGSIRSPLWRHGGVVFGPNGRRYAQRMPEKMRRAAFGEAVSERAAAGRILVLEELRFDGERPRTREVVAWLRQIGDTGRTMVVSPELDERIGRAVANLPDIELRTPGSLRLSDVMESDTLLVTRPALEALAARAGERAEARA
ncbi:MAG TPA: 50S ribosomal protein L4 [Candidatus Limnocylindria bacterium]|jgi:large subunit ribosomal protein L4|nr:50S ribosomal protein L4 [Candidatus Limnocylindria bacterium]